MGDHGGLWKDRDPLAVQSPLCVSNRAASTVPMLPPFRLLRRSLLVARSTVKWKLYGESRRQRDEWLADIKDVVSALKSDVVETTTEGRVRRLKRHSSAVDIS
jgi:hypothetical protein